MDDERRNALYDSVAYGLVGVPMGDEIGHVPSMTVIFIVMCLCIWFMTFKLTMSSVRSGTP